MKRKQTSEKFQKLRFHLYPDVDQKVQRWSRQIPSLIDSSFRLAAQANLFTRCNFLKLFMLLKEDYLHKTHRSDQFRGCN